MLGKDQLPQEPPQQLTPKGLQRAHLRVSAGLASCAGILEVLTQVQIQPLKTPGMELITMEPKWVITPFQPVLLYQYKSTKAQGQSQKYSICLWGRFPGTANKEVQVTHTGHKLLSSAQMMFSLWRTGI